MEITTQDLQSLSLLISTKLLKCLALVQLLMKKVISLTECQHIPLSVTIFYIKKLLKHTKENENCSTKNCAISGMKEATNEEFTSQTSEVLSQEDNKCKIDIIRLNRELNKGVNMVDTFGRTRRINNTVLSQKLLPDKINIEDIEVIMKKYHQEARDIRSQGSCSSFHRMLSSN